MARDPYYFVPPDWKVISGKEGKAFFHARLTGINHLFMAVNQLTRDEKSAMRRQLRKVNKDAAQLAVDRAKELAPVSARKAPPTKHLKGAIRNTSSERSVKITAGNKNVWWNWMRHAGTTDTVWPSGRNYPPGVPYLRDGVNQVKPQLYKMHERGMAEVIKTWNAEQRRAFKAAGGKT